METVTVDRLNVIISATKADFDKKINEVTHQLDDMNDKIDKVGEDSLGVFRNLASGLKALGIGAMIKSAINLAGDLEQNIGGSESVFKDYAAVVQQTASTAASSLGLSESKYLATANKMGALFQGSGFSIAKSADMTTQAMQRASDVASIMGIEVDSAMEAVAGMAKGNFTMMDNLGVAINDTNLQLYAQEKGLGKLETTQQKVNAAMQMFIDKTDYAAGNYARENDTYSGALTTLKAEFENFAAEAGTALLPLAQSVLPIASQLLNELKPAVVIAAEAIGSLGSVVTDISEKVNNAEPGTKMALKIAVGMAVAIPAVSVATKALAAAKALYSGVLSILIPKQLTFASALKATMGWIGIIIGALALIGLASESGADSIGDSAENLEKENEAAQGAADGIGKVADSTDNLTDSVSRATAGFDEINKLGSSSSTLGSALVSSEDVENAENISSTFNEVQRQLNDTDFDTGFSAIFDALYGGVKAVWGWLTNDVFSFGVDIFTAIFGSGEDKYKALQRIVEKIKLLFGEDFVNFWTDVGGNINKIFTGTEEERYEALKDLDSKFREFFGEFGEEWSDFWKDVGEGIFKFANGDLYGGLNEINSKFEGLFGELGKKWSTTFQNLGAGLYELTHSGEIDMVNLSSKYSTLYSDMASEIVSELRNGVSSTEAIQNAKSKYIDTSEKIYFFNNDTGNFITEENVEKWAENISQSAIKKITGLRFGNMSTFASGGFPDYGDIFVANERGPEMVGSIGGRTAVVNNSQIETAIENAVARGMSRAGGNGQPIEIHVYTELDGEVIGESVTEYQSNQTRRDNGYKK